jgi:hypothetical protein
MKITKITPWIIFALVLLLAWMTLGGSSGYYEDPQLLTAAPPVAVAPGASSKYTMKSAMDYMGSTAGMYPTNNPDSCAALCDTKFDCAGYVIDTKGACLLKSNFGKAVMSANRNTYAKPGIDLP